MQHYPDRKICARSTRTGRARNQCSAAAVASAACTRRSPSAVCTTRAHVQSLAPCTRKAATRVHAGGRMRGGAAGGAGIPAPLRVTSPYLSAAPFRAGGGPGERGPARSERRHRNRSDSRRWERGRAVRGALCTVRAVSGVRGVVRGAQSAVLAQCMALGAGCTVSGVLGVVRGHTVQDAQCIERGARCSVQGARGGAGRTVRGARCRALGTGCSVRGVQDVALGEQRERGGGAGHSVHGAQCGVLRHPLQGSLMWHSAQDAQCIALSTGCSAQDAQCRLLSAGCSVSSVHKAVVQGARCMAPSAGCSVQGAQCMQCCSVHEAVHDSQCRALHVGFCSLPRSTLLCPCFPPGHS